MEWPQARQEATEKYAAQVKRSADGLPVLDSVAGLFNQGQKAGVTDDCFTVAALVNAGR